MKAAIAALEDAGFIERGNNVPHIFATGITVGNMNEARTRLTCSPLFDETNREEAARIIHSLISSRATSRNLDGEAESRIDYLADILGMKKETVIRNVNLMRQEGILSDSRDMQAWITKSTTAKELEQTLKLEQYILSHLTPGITLLNYKELNESANREEIPKCTIRRIKTLLYFLSLKGYIRKEEYTASGNANIELQTDPHAIKARFELRMDICRFIVRELLSATNSKDQTQPTGIAIDPDRKSLVNFSEVELLNRYLQSGQQMQFGNGREVTMGDIEEALLYLTKTSILKIEGGFLVIYNTMQLERKAERKARYTKEQYRMLDEFYKQRIRQIHIVGEYANLMVRDYNAALQFVNDYFQMDYRKFIAKYFKDERKSEIDKNITPAKYHQIFGCLDKRQLQIINDKQSKYIAVAAGPGSGKTRVLVHKLASLLLLEDVKHEQLLMLTFSRSAATEFKKRLIELIGNAAHFVEIKTFHSYSFDLLGKMGNLDEAGNIVQQAAEMIENSEVEESKIAKSVLVIDEAQDMGADENRLLLALMHRNEDMRVIAVGDDDQNIYAFRGSDSAHLRALVTDHHATLYEMTTNYRSTQAIVDLSNHFATLIPDRMKQTPCTASTSDIGTVEMHLYDNTPFLYETIDTITRSYREGETACVLTRTNEESMQLDYLLKQKGLHTKLIQTIGGFSFYHLAEIRYFLQQLPTDTGRALPQNQWDIAKTRTLQKYNGSNSLDILEQFFSDFETTHHTIYYSDLIEYLYESNIEDFTAPNGKTVFISTIHKAKGREFDTVHLIVPSLREEDAPALRTLYVGLTRAKRNLYIHTHNTPFCGMASPIRHHVEPSTHIPITIALTHRDVFLDYFKNNKSVIMELRSGDPLRYSNGFLYNMQNEGVAVLSQACREKMKQLETKGYQVTSAEVSFVVAWSPKEDNEEYAVCLANLHLTHSGS